MAELQRAAIMKPLPPDEAATRAILYGFLALIVAIVILAAFAQYLKP